MDYPQNYDRENTANDTTTHDREPAAPLPTDNETAAGLLIKYCPQLAAEGQAQDTEKSIFRLKSSLGETKDNKSAAIKMDAPYKDCYRKLDKQRSQMKALSREVSQNVRIETEDYEKYFSSPSVPDVAFRVGDSHAKNQHSGWNFLRSKNVRSSEWQLSAIDAAARASTRLAMYQGYLATALHESHTLGVSEIY